MALSINKFRELGYLQRRKKLCYYLHRSIQENTLEYTQDISAMIDLLNNEEYRQIEFQPNLEYLKKLYYIFHQEILENDPFQEDILFDKPNTERILLNSKIGIILENIRSPFNVGSFFRMAEAFGIHEIIATGVTPSPETEKKVHKTTKGSLIPFRIFNTIEDFLHQENNKPILFGIEKAKGSIPFDKMEIISKEYSHYLVFGNEEFGVSTSTLSLCKAIYHIPMLGAKNSLNVSVAGGIMLNHVAHLVNGDF